MGVAYSSAEEMMGYFANGGYYQGLGLTTSTDELDAALKSAATTWDAAARRPITISALKMSRDLAYIYPLFETSMPCATVTPKAFVTRSPARLSRLVFTPSMAPLNACLVFGSSIVAIPSFRGASPSVFKLSPICSILAGSTFISINAASNRLPVYFNKPREDER